MAPSQRKEANRSYTSLGICKVGNLHICLVANEQISRLGSQSAPPLALSPTAML